MCERSDLKFCQGGCDGHPHIARRVGTRVNPVGLKRQPAIRLRVNSDDGGNEGRKVPGKNADDWIFVEVRLSDGLEPNCRTIGLETEEAKGRTRIQLTEVPGRSEAQSGYLARDPLLDYAHPTGFRKKTG